MARGAHRSPQRQLFPKRRKSQLKTAKRLQNNAEVLNKFK